MSEVKEIWVLEGDGSLSKPRCAYTSRLQADRHKLPPEEPVRYVPEASAQGEAGRTERRRGAEGMLKVLRRHADAADTQNVSVEYMDAFVHELLDRACAEYPAPLLPPPPKASP